MQITFTRASARDVAVTVERGDGAILQTRSSGAAKWLPHDLIHYVVERELGIDDGLWGRVANGAKFRSFQMLRPARTQRRRRSKPTRHPGRRKGVLEAEVLVGLFDDIWTGAAVREWGSTRAFLDTIWSPRTRSRADELDERTIRRVCDALTEAERAWRTVPVGGGLSLRW
jgi:hypothetical protein